ncbi:MAG: hypothetical protein IJT83_05880 [Victivallales bacterium]|nr:hypothetical protein [Victivallales bacterium]
MAENDLDDVLSIFDEPKDKGEGQPQAEASADAQAQAAAPQKPAAGKPGLGKPGMGKPGLGKPGMTGPRPPVGVAKPAPQATAPKAPAQPAAGKPVVGVSPAIPPVVAAPASSGTSPLLYVLLALNVILIFVTAFSVAKVNAMKNEITQIKLDTETLKARSKVHAGIAYLGNDKRPQRFVMLLDFEKKPGSVEFGKEIMQPFE